MVLGEHFEPDFTVAYDTLESLQAKHFVRLRGVKHGIEIVILEPGSNNRSEAHPPILVSLSGVFVCSPR